MEYTLSVFHIVLSEQMNWVHFQRCMSTVTEKHLPMLLLKSIVFLPIPLLTNLRHSVKIKFDPSFYYSLLRWPYSYSMY